MKRVWDAYLPNGDGPVSLGEFSNYVATASLCGDTVQLTDYFMFNDPEELGHTEIGERG